MAPPAKTPTALSCAYCKKKGHHINDCRTRARNNNKQSPGKQPQKNTGRQPQRPPQNRLSPLLPHLRPDNAEGTAISQFYNAGGQVASTHEILFRVTDFFDTNAADVSGNYITQWRYRAVQSAFNPPASAGQSVAWRLVGCDWYVLPSFETGTNATTTLLSLFSLPAVIPGGKNASNSGNFEVNIAQQSTLITPTANIKWLKVGHWRADRELKSANATLVANTSGDQVGGNIAIVDPDSGAPVTDLNCQVRVDALVSVPINTICQQYMGDEDINFWNAAADVPTQNHSCFLQPLAIRNTN